MNFEEFKNIVITRAEKCRAYFLQPTRVKATENFNELFNLIKDDIAWFLNEHIITQELILNVYEEAKKNNIYIPAVEDNFTFTPLYSGKVLLIKYCSVGHVYSSLGAYYTIVIPE
jgi:hypothetical protein